MTKVYLSPSGQNHNVGAYPAGTSEEYWARRIAAVTDRYLKSVPGIETKMGPDLPEDGYAENVTESNNWGADVHVCFHTNVGRGTMLCYMPGADDSLKLAQALYGVITPITPDADSQVARSDLYELNGTNATAALIEFDGHDVPAGAEFIMKHVEEFGKATAQGILAYLGLTLPSSSNANVVTPDGKATLMTGQQLVDLLLGVTWGSKEDNMLFRFVETFKAAKLILATLPTLAKDVADMKATLSGIQLAKDIADIKAKLNA